jgi:hypothetical protein
MAHRGAPFFICHLSEAKNLLSVRQTKTEKQILRKAQDDRSFFYKVGRLS